MTLYRTPIFMLLITALTGCGSVIYHDGTGQDYEGNVKYNLQSSVLMLNYADTEKKTAYTIISVPAESELHRYTIEAADWLGFMKTNLQVTKRDNTDLIEKLGFEVQDNRAKIITAIGTMSAAAPVLLENGTGQPKSNSDLPFFFDTEPLLIGGTRGDIPRKDIKSGSYTATIEIKAVPGDAIPIADFIKNKFNKHTDVFFYSACRKATVEFTPPPVPAVAVAPAEPKEPTKGKKATPTLGSTQKPAVQPPEQVVALVISDPNFVQTIKSPGKGSIKMHTSCGADVTAESADIASGTEVLSALVAQAKSYKEAKAKADVGGNGVPTK
jgi:uncharacterized protein YceK